MENRSSARPQKTALLLAQRIVRDIDQQGLGPGDKHAHRHGEAAQRRRCLPGGRPALPPAGGLDLAEPVFGFLVDVALDRPVTWANHASLDSLEDVS